MKKLYLAEALPKIYPVPGSLPGRKDAEYYGTGGRKLSFRELAEKWAMRGLSMNDLNKIVNSKKSASEYGDAKRKFGHFLVVSDPGVAGKLRYVDAEELGQDLSNAFGWTNFAGIHIGPEKTPRQNIAGTSRASEAVRERNADRTSDDSAWKDFEGDSSYSDDPELRDHPDDAQADSQWEQEADKAEDRWFERLRQIQMKKYIARSLDDVNEAAEMSLSDMLFE